MRILLGLLVCFAVLQIAVRFWPPAVNHSFFDRAFGALGCQDGQETTLTVPGGFAQAQGMDDDTFERLVDAAVALPRATVVDRTAGAATIVVRSALWGFPDVLRLTHTSGCGVVASHLTLGHSDMGVNRVRIQALLADL